MTPEVQNEIISQFWGIVPTLMLFILGGAILGIGYKLLEKKLFKKINNKKNKKNDK